MAPRESPDWDYLAQLDTNDLDDDKVEQVYESLSEFSVDTSLPVDKLALGFNILQAVMRWQQEEVDAAMEQLDDLQKVREEKEDLAGELDRLRREGGAANGGVDELLQVERDLQQALRQIQTQDKLLDENRMDKERLEKKLDSLEATNKQLEAEQQQLQAQLEQTRQAVQDSATNGNSLDMEEVSIKKMTELEDGMRLKNKQIHQLLEDIDLLEEDNLSLKTNLTELRDQLENATRQIDSVTKEYLTMKGSLTDSRSLIDSLETDNNLLKTKLEDQYRMQAKRDKQIQEISHQVDSRVDEMRRVCDAKEAEITELRSRLNRASILASGAKEPSSSDRNIALMSQAIAERDQQIANLEQELTKASNELESSAKLLNDMKGSVSIAGTDPLQSTLAETRGELLTAREKIKELEEQVLEAEDSAKEKAEELTDVIGRLRKYEEGEYGLSKAVSEVQNLKKEKKARDKQIDELLTQLNSFECDNNSLLEENSELREKLGMEKHELSKGRKMSGGRKSSYRVGDSEKANAPGGQTERALLQVLQRELERLEEERIQLKTENRKLAQQLGLKAVKLGLDAGDLQAIQEYTEALKNRRSGLLGVDQSDSLNVIKMHEGGLLMQRELQDKAKEIIHLKKELAENKSKQEELFDENDKLRVGMHEILDNIREQDGSSDVLVSSPVLEKLLTLLDARHNYGESAMKNLCKPSIILQAQLDRLEGVNSELREQLRKARIEDDKAVVQLQRMKAKYLQQEAELNAIKQGNGYMQQQQPMQIMAQVPQVPQVATQLSGSSAETIAKLSSQLVYVLDELSEKEKAGKSLEKSLETYSRDFQAIKHQLGLLLETYHEASAKWGQEKQDLDKKISQLEEQRDGQQAKLAEYEQHFALIDKDEDTVNGKLAEFARKLGLLKSNEAIMIRRYKALEEAEKLTKRENVSLKAEIIELENHTLTTIGELQRTKDMNIYKIEALQNKLEESVPISSLETANRQYNEITAKYRDILQKQQAQSQQFRALEELELQLSSLKQEKQSLQKELQMSKEKVLSMESLINSVGLPQGSEIQPELDKLVKQVATLEVKELNERQKSDYLDNQHKLVQTQLQQVEARNSDLEEKLELITKSNLELQKIERQLRDELITSVPQSQYGEISDKLQESEEKVIKLSTENSKLREMVDVAQNQVVDLEARKNSHQLVIESLQHQTLDLQSQTDEKAMIGRLHQQILSLQNKDLKSEQMIKSLKSKMMKQESALFKTKKRNNDLEQIVLKIKGQNNIKIRFMYKVIQDLRRQYSGSIPLSKQEKMAQNLIEINLEKQRTSILLSETETKLRNLEKEREEMDIKKKGIDEIMTTLKHGTGTKQILNWHSKLEDLRLKELHFRRTSEQMEKEVMHLRELSKNQTNKIEQLEEEIVKLETMFEQKQLEWESRDFEMEKIDIQTFKKEMMDETKEENLVIENQDLPLSKQLEIALSKNKALGQSLKDVKKKLEDSRQAFESLSKKCRDLESNNLAKERTINDLRLQIPATVDRAIAITSVIGQPGIPAACIVEGDNGQGMTIAQTTIESLRERLKHKEETILRYEELLKQSNEEHAKVLHSKQQEIIDLEQSLRVNQALYNELRTSKNIENISESSTIHQYVTQCQQLEDEVQELQNNLGEANTQLSEYKVENEKLQKTIMSKKEEISNIKEGIRTEDQEKIDEQHKEIEALKANLKSVQQENVVLRSSVQEMREMQSKAPSTVMKSLVEKLKSDLAEKERKQKAMSRVINDLKNELIMTAEEGAAKSAETQRFSNVQKMVEMETKSLQVKVNEQKSLIDKMKSQLKQSKEQESKCLADLSKCKEALEKKSSLVLRLREEKMSTSRSGTSKPIDDEKEELKAKVKSLEERLNMMNKAEKPYEEEHESKIIKNAEEVARWDERKKWQKKVEELKQKLKDADEEVSKVTKQNSSLREVFSRIEREKTQLEQKWKNHMKFGNIKNSEQEKKFDALQKEIVELKSKLEIMEHKEILSQDPNMETMKLRIKFLQDRVEQQEKKISILELLKKGGTEALIKEIEALRKKDAQLQKSRLKREDLDLDVKVKVETLEHNMHVIQDLFQEYNDLLKGWQIDGGKDEERKKMMKIITDVCQISEKFSDLTQKKLAPETLAKGQIATVIPSPRKEHHEKEIDNLKKELESSKQTLNDLREALEIRERKIAELNLILADSKDLTTGQHAGQHGADDKSHIRQLEIDLKRKSDLLSEVKVLLKQAADKERQQDRDKEELRRQLKLVMEVNPKTPGETLAKELRQLKLTVDRLECEKKELNHSLQMQRAAN